MKFLGDDVSNFTSETLGDSMSDLFPDTSTGSTASNTTSDNSNWLTSLVSSVSGDVSGYLNAKETGAMAPLTIINEVMLGAGVIVIGIIIYKIVSSNNNAKIKMARS